MAELKKNKLFYGDNLAVLREYITDESVDLIYLDPPFNSNRTYNVLFKDESGKESEAQIAAFDDTWHWDAIAEETYYELITGSSNAVSRMIGALREFIGTNQMMAYLVMMTIRLIELHRVLKSTGSLYLHCDPMTSHYLKIVLDAIFGHQSGFRNEIIWHYRRWPAKQKNFQRMHDVILFYSKQYRQNTFNILFNELSVGTQKRWRGKKSKVEFQDGVRLTTQETDEASQGAPMDDVWDIPIINSQAKERLGYPTQKPLILLERIVEASSNEGNVVLDPFCGCGTTVAAAEKLNRCWIGIDITHLAIALQKYRLQESFPEAEFEVIGEPESIGAARFLAEQDRFQFEWWALSLVKARPGQSTGTSKKGKKGADRGIDGVINFIDSIKGEPKRVLVQVKSGKVNSATIRDLRGVVEREKAAIGVLLTLEPSTQPMRTEAVSAGYYESKAWGKKYPKIQIFTVEELLRGTQIEMPPAWGTFKQAERVEKEGPKQSALF